MYFAIFGSLAAAGYAWASIEMKKSYMKSQYPDMVIDTAFMKIEDYAKWEANRRIGELREQGLTPEDTGMYQQFPFARRRNEIIAAKKRAAGSDDE